MQCKWGPGGELSKSGNEEGHHLSLGCSRREGLGSSSWGGGNRRLRGTELRLRGVYWPGDRAEGGRGVVQEYLGWSGLEGRLVVRAVGTV